MDAGRAYLLTGAFIAALAAAGNTLRATEPRAAADLRLREISTPAAGPFVEETLDRDFHDALRARDVLYRIFTRPDGEPVWLFLGYFDRQKEGSQVHSPRHCYPGSGWYVEAEPHWPSPWGGGELASLVVNDGGERRLVLYWYQLRAGTESGVLPLKLEMTRRALLREPQDVVFASVSTPTGADVRATMAALSPLANAVHAEIERLYRSNDGRRARS